MLVLTIESDGPMTRSIEMMLKSEGIHVYTTDLGEEGIDLAKIYAYDIITLDLDLPDMSGLSVIKAMRLAKITTPILVLTSHAEIDVKKEVYAAGADDYLTKPFHRDELVARIRAVVRRANGHAESIIRIGPIAINLDAKSITVNGRKVHLTGKEFQMLELLSLRKGVTLSKETFLNYLYGGMDEPQLKIIDVFICKIRKKIAAVNGGVHHIDTVWGRGYLLRDPTPAGERLRRPDA